MSKDKNKFITIIVLLAITITILFTFSNLDLGNNLNANSNNPPPNNNTPFTYENPRESEFSNIIFENNIGGSENDELSEVYALDYYYIVGNTKSNDFYFQNNQHSNNVFIGKLTKSGNIIDIAEGNSNSVYVSSMLTGFGIYILTKSMSDNTSYLLFYDFSSTNISEILQFNNFSAEKIVKNNQIIIIIGLKNNKLTAYFFNENTKALTDSQSSAAGNEIIFSAPYLSGSIVFLNNTNSFSIYYISEEKYELLYYSNSYKILNFQINTYGYFLVLNNDSSAITIFLNSNFEKLTQYSLTLHSTDIALFNMNNNFYLAYVNSSNNLIINIYSGKGDLVFNVILNYVTNKILGCKHNNNYAILAFSTMENNLIVLTINKLTYVTKELLVSFSQNSLTIFIEEEYNNTYVLFGTIDKKNNLITNNYGKKDIFIFKCSNIN